MNGLENGIVNFYIAGTIILIILILLGIAAQKQRK